MSRNSERPGSKELRKSNPSGMSNSFNPPVAARSNVPLPAIGNQTYAVASPTTIKQDSGSDEVDRVLPMKVFQASKKSVKDLSQAACSYLWFRRIKEIYLVMGKQTDAFARFDMELARTDMIQTCDQYLESERPKGGGVNLGKTEQDKLDRWKNKRLYAETFRMSYSRQDAESDDKTVKVPTLQPNELSGGEVPNFDNAIWWYSCNEAPIFDQMNNILRLENFELLMCHRYYISDLCQMIERAHVQNKLVQKLLVYRADKITQADFNGMEKLKEQKDARITINGFISTSKDEKISLEYAEAKLKKKGDDVVIMYEITIDPAVPCSSYADIESISFHPREREVLFNMGSTFQIDGIIDDPKNANIKRIKLTAKDFNLALLDEMKAKVKQSSPATLSILLVRYLIELGEDRVSKRYLNQIIDSKQLEDDSNLVAVYNCLGTINSRQALHGDALDFYRKALNCQARLQFSNNNALAEIFNNIGQTHLGLNQLEEAQQNLEEGIRIQKREPKYAQQHLASLYCNMGQVDYARENYDEAETNFQLAYDLYNRNTKISHDALEKRLLKADLCIAFGHLKSVQNPKDSTEAKEKFDEALQIYESTLPSSHPKVAEAHIDIVCEYARNKNFQAVIDYQDDHFLQLLKDYETKQTTSQQDLANLYAIIGACYAHKKDFQKAMEMWERSIKHEQKSFLDQLLSSSRVSKITPPGRSVEIAYLAALQNYSNDTKAPREYLAILCTEAYMYEQAIDHLREKSSYLLAHLCVLQRKFKGCMKVYKRILELKEYDLTLTISILLRILATKNITSMEEPISELIRIENQLARKISDNDAIRLRMIINDYLAEAYLLMGKDSEALQYSRVSFDLKQRHYSSYHPSLVRNYQLAAECTFQRKDYKAALQHYEKAVEIQLDNMPSGHTDLRSNYFLMGHCYCQMDKIELANEYYDRAQAPNDIDAEEETEVECDVKALILMHANLANIFDKQEDFTSASSHQQENIDHLKQLLPTFIVKLIEDEGASSISFDLLQTTLAAQLGLSNGETFGRVLRNRVVISYSLARVLLRADQWMDDDKDSTDVYEQAVPLELKLTMFQRAGENRLLMLYEELADAYAKSYTSMTDTVQENLDHALEETTDIRHQASLEYRLGNLSYDEKDYSNADEYWKSALKKVSDSQPIVKSILEKLIEKNKINLSSPEDTSDEDEDEESDTTSLADDEEKETNEPNSRVPTAKSQRRLSMKSTKSMNDKEKPEELAQAYLDLEDNETALKYLKKYAAKLEETVKPAWPSLEITEDKLPLITFFHSLLLQTISSSTASSLKSAEIPDQDLWTNLLETYKNIFTVTAQSTQTFDDSSKANSAAFQISQKLYKLPNTLIKTYSILFESQSDEIQWKELQGLLPTDQFNDILMRVAAYYVSKDSHTEALEVYCVLQKNTRSEEILKSAVDYGMLKIFHKNLPANDDYRANLMGIDIRSSKIPLFDRILLCRLIISFWEELNDQPTSAAFQKELRSLQTQLGTIDDLAKISCIGQILTKVENYPLACLYWSELQDLYNEMLPDSIVTRLTSTDSTFEQIFRATQEMYDGLLTNIRALAESYELLAKYEEHNECKNDAQNSLGKATIIWNKIPSEKGKVAQLKDKINSLNSN